MRLSDDSACATRACISKHKRAFRKEAILTHDNPSHIPRTLPPSLVPVIYAADIPQSGIPPNFDDQQFSEVGARRRSRCVRQHITDSRPAYIARGRAFVGGRCVCCWGLFQAKLRSSTPIQLLASLTAGKFGASYNLQQDEDCGALLSNAWPPVCAPCLALCVDCT